MLRSVLQCVAFFADMQVERTALVVILHVLSCMPTLVMSCSGATSITDVAVSSSEYVNGMDCHWSGNCDSGHPHIEFSSFQTESGYDYLRICASHSSASPVLVTFPH